MVKVVIDARESGTSTGRYVDKLIEYLHALKPAHNIIIITKSDRLDFFGRIAPKFSTVETTYKEFSFGEQLGFKSQLESLKPDLVHFAMVQQPVLYRGEVVTTVHDLTTTRFRNPSKNSLVFTIKQRVYRRVVKAVARKSRALITPSEFVKQDLVDFTGVDPGKITVTHEAADNITEPSKPLLTLKNKQFIMYVGRPLPHKNLARLIDAFGILQKEFPGLYLVLAGKKDALYEEHELRVKQLSLKNVIFTGFVSEGELRWLYENTACYVFPSLSEGFGLPGLEAMTHGAVVASSNATCLPEIYQDAAAYFNPQDPVQIAMVVKDILNNPDYVNKIRTKARERVICFSWEKMAKETLAVYDSVLNKS